MKRIPTRRANLRLATRSENQVNKRINTRLVVSLCTAALHDLDEK